MKITAKKIVENGTPSGKDGVNPRFKLDGTVYILNQELTYIISTRKLNSANSDKERVLKVFKEDSEDQELTIRLQGMVSKYESDVDSFNKDVEHHHQILQLRDMHLTNMKNLIVVVGSNLEDTTKKIVDYNIEIQKSEEHLSSFRTNLDTQATLIKKYKDINRNRWFTWWKILKAIGETTHDWTLFYDKNKHIQL
jgi:hypothetical protein